MSKEDRVYFKGINGLRFFAALAVIITHIELIKSAFGMSHAWREPMIFYLGGLGVYFFFVLSGFLITYLLLVEKDRSGKIAVRSFYMRRILRIWPLYYLILMLGFFVLPHFTGIQIPYLQQAFEENYQKNLLLYILILPNLAFAMFPAVPHIGQLWSIGVEEQFYILWPLLIARVRSVSRALIWVITGLVVIKAAVLFLGNWYGTEKWYQVLKLFLAMSKFECMAIGGLGAYFLFTNEQKILQIIFNKIVLWLCVFAIPLIIYFAPAVLQDGIHLVFACIFLVIILNVSRDSDFLERPLISYLGKISYGIYMYHLMIIPIVLWGIKKIDLNLNGVQLNVFIYMAVIALTILISALSYKFLEKPFMSVKARFAKVQSGNV